MNKNMKTAHSNKSIDIKAVAINIEKVCKSRNMAVRTLMIQCNLAISVVDNMKKGCMPSFDKVYIIAKKLDIPVEKLVSTEFEL
jgi:hypothetical protein